MQFVGPVKKSWIGAVTRAGAKVRQPCCGFAYVVRANAATVKKLRALPQVSWVGHVPHEARIASALREAAGNKKAQKVAPRHARSRRMASAVHG